jgi:hypothetical protein
VTSVPEPPGALRSAAEAIVAALAPPAADGPVVIDWPVGLTVGSGVDLGTVVRSMRATEARYAPIILGPTVAGDGERTATFRLESPRGRVDLALELDVASGCLSSVALVPARLSPPDLD